MAIEVQSEFRDVIDRICDGSDDAVWEFIDKFGPHVQRAIRQRLHQQMRSKFDSVDFVQMVWASFFTHPKRMASFRDPTQLVKYLVGMAKNKVHQESRRRLEYQAYDLKRERNLEQKNGDDSQRLASNQTPSQMAIARERYDDLMREQTERNRQIVKMRISGKTYLEISESLGINERTARQVITEMAGTTT